MMRSLYGMPKLRFACAAVTVLVIGAGNIDFGGDSVSFSAGAPAYAQQSGAPGGSGNQGTGTGPGSTARTNNQNRAGGGGGGGGPTGTVPTGLSPTGGGMTDHNAYITQDLSADWCADVGKGGVGDEARFNDKNLLRIDMAIARFADTQKVPTGARTHVANYQRIIEGGKQGPEAAGEMLKKFGLDGLTEDDIRALNQILCLNVGDDKVMAIAKSAGGK